MGNAASQHEFTMIAARKEAALNALERVLQSHINSLALTPLLEDAFSYAVFPGGKRIRPIFTLLLCEDLGGQSEALVLPSASIEILHCASLVHDDLPALDNDDMRRGRSSTHKKFGEATAILVADLMIASAPTAILASDYDSVIKTEMISLISDAFKDLCIGQQLDLEGVKSKSELELLHRLKTAALFRASAGFAALAAGVNKNIFLACLELGERIGMTFQMVDDYIDIFGTAAQRGRPESSDTRNKKLTLFRDGEKTKGLELLQELRSEISRGLSVLKQLLPKTQEFPGVESIVQTIFDHVVA